jgi:hypothetical protein
MEKVQVPDLELSPIIDRGIIISIRTFRGLHFKAAVALYSAYSFPCGHMRNADLDPGTH